APELRVAGDFLLPGGEGLLPLGVALEQGGEIPAVLRFDLAAGGECAGYSSHWSSSILSGMRMGARSGLLRGGCLRGRAVFRNPSDPEIVLNVLPLQLRQGRFSIALQQQ